MAALDTSEVPDYQAQLRLDGKRFVVAGAGQGIGRQTTHALAAAGATTLCIDYDAAAAEHVAKEVDGVPFVGDVREREQIESAFAIARSELGGVDGVVDIVGMARYGPLLDTSDEDWDWTFGMVLRHAFLLAQIGGRVMAENDGGVMTFIASVSGITSAPLHAPYGAAKAGLVSLVRTAAVELGPKGVRANAVAPGVVWTPRISELLGERGRDDQARNAPLRRVAQPSDIAAAALFLSSDLSSYVTGQVLVVDGGVSAKFPYGMNDVT
jgi:NAD(P)-dependent dehydrogenase (short-subunit alcohol dehydrogenase family)